jgi:hypothetical protein
MRELVLKNLSRAIDASIVHALVCAYEDTVAEYKKGNLDGCLNASGKYVEHTLRAVEFIRLGVALGEVKSVSATAREIEKDQSLPESVRLLIPRIGQAAIYDIRSKRGAVHVKEIDPRYIDASLARIIHEGQRAAVCRRA